MAGGTEKGKRVELASGSPACMTGSTEIPLQSGHVSPKSGTGFPDDLALRTDQQLLLEDFYVF